MGLLRELHMHPAQKRASQRAGRIAAQHYLWPQILSGILVPRLRLLAVISPHEATLEHGESRGVNDLAR
jgi:hypothetical protein